VGRDAATRVARELRARGFQALFAGGCVRDELLGLAPKDYDVATDATPDEVRSIFQRSHGVGVAFGVVLVRLMGCSVEVTTFRSDGQYADGRRPVGVSYSRNPVDDARRRDFTINGLYRDPDSGEVIDLVGGRADLDRRVLRAIGDAEARLSEDRLRMLRGVRFAARFDLSIDPATRAAIERGAADLRGISRERIGQEIERMLDHPSRARAASLVESLGLDAPVFDESHLVSDLSHVRSLPAAAGYVAALAGWWVDRKRGLPGAGQGGVAAWRRALVLSNRHAEGLTATLHGLGVLRSEWGGLAVARRMREAASPWFDAALMLKAAEDPAEADRIRAEVSRLGERGLAPPPLITGDDLAGLGMPPGPSYRTTLEAAYDAQLEGRITDRESALRWLQNRLGTSR